jgi:hypothetical protein
MGKSKKEVIQESPTEEQIKQDVAEIPHAEEVSETLDSLEKESEIIPADDYAIGDLEKRIDGLEKEIADMKKKMMAVDVPAVEEKADVRLLTESVPVNPAVEELVRLHGKCPFYQDFRKQG